MDTLAISGTGAVAARHQLRPVFLDPARLPWTPWVMPDTWFKLLSVNDKTGGFTMLLKVQGPNRAPIHHHIGEIEGYIVEGEFGYGPHDRGGPGAYALEAAGAIHEPDTEQGFVMFMIAHGPLVGYNPDGSVALLLDGEKMYELARQHSVADHLERPQRFR